jgi:hypothetical protein
MSNFCKVKAKGRGALGVFTAFPGKRAPPLKSEISKDELISISAHGSDHNSRTARTLFVVWNSRPLSIAIAIYLERLPCIRD